MCVLHYIVLDDEIVPRILSLLASGTHNNNVLRTYRICVRVYVYEVVFRSTDTMGRVFLVIRFTHTHTLTHACAYTLACLTLYTSNAQNEYIYIRIYYIGTSSAPRGMIIQQDFCSHVRSAFCVHGSTCARVTGRCLTSSSS